MKPPTLLSTFLALVAIVAQPTGSLPPLPNRATPSPALTDFEHPDSILSDFDFDDLEPLDASLFKIDIGDFLSPSSAHNQNGAGLEGGEHDGFPLRGWNDGLTQPPTLMPTLDHSASVWEQVEQGLMPPLTAFDRVHEEDHSEPMAAWRSGLPISHTPLEDVGSHRSLAEGGSVTSHSYPANPLDTASGRTSESNSGSSSSKKRAAARLRRLGFTMGPSKFSPHGITTWGDASLSLDVLVAIRQRLQLPPGSMDRVRYDSTLLSRRGESEGLMSWLSSLYRDLKRHPGARRILVELPTRGSVVLLSPRRQEMKTRPNERVYVAMAIRPDDFRRGKNYRTMLGEIVVDSALAEVLRHEYLRPVRSVLGVPVSEVGEGGGRGEQLDAASGREGL